MNKINRFADYLGRILAVSIAIGALFLVVGLGVYYMASGNAEYILETFPYAALSSALVFVVITTYLDYRGIEIKKSLLVGALFGVTSFSIVIALVEGAIFLVEKELTQPMMNKILIAFSFCIIGSSIMLWVAKSRFYGGE